MPRATYRLQLHRGFTFAQATELVPYLAALGVSHVYLSPYFKARPGSSHGYDIIDHNALNPEIGDRADFDRLCAALRQHGMGQVVDIVPNHMGVLGTDNERWLDVLENGRASGYAHFFDIDWDRTPDELGGKLLLPVLGDPYGSVLARGEIALAFEAGHGSFALRYFEQHFPLNPQTYAQILAPVAERLRGSDAAVADEIDSLSVSFGAPPVATNHAPELRRSDHTETKRRLAELCARSATARNGLDEEVRQLNGRAGDAASFDALHALIAAQAYRIASWRMAADDINYRRFVDVNELAAVRMEDPAVFDETHSLLFELIGSGQVTGVRVDHADGLYDPGQYFARLQQGAERRLYLVIEKILAPGECLPESWPIAGTTGYEFADLVNGLFVDPRAEAKLTHTYFAFLREHLDYDEVVYRSKRLIMGVAVASELSALATRISRIAQADRTTCDFTYASQRAALAEIVASFPTYRTYVTGEGVSDQDRRIIDRAVRAAKRRSVASERTVFDFVRDVLTTDLAQSRPPEQRAEIVELAQRFQQFSAPVMAKGLEDTTFYRYNRLCSLNEVGGDPRRFGISVAEFHRANAERAKSRPNAMLDTSTHDSKRSEDVRARLNVLSEIPFDWETRIAKWRRFNRAKRHRIGGRPVPSRPEEYLFYQTLVGSWPVVDRADAMPEYRSRISAYMIKALREAKINTSWAKQSERYETLVSGFVSDVLSNGASRNPFLDDLDEFVRSIAMPGFLNGLGQTLLKLTSPGVPDIYQGNEVWDFSLVDPDNRRPVDYARRAALLEEIEDVAADPKRIPALLGDMLANLADGRAKLYATWRALRLRAERPELFELGSYAPIEPRGPRAEHLCALARRRESALVVAVVGRWFASLPRNAGAGPASFDWLDTTVALPPGVYRDVFSEVSSTVEEGAGARVGELLARFPIALLVCDDTA